MFEPAVSLLTIATMIAAAFGLGRPVLRGLQLDRSPSTATVVWSVAVGWILAGFVLMLLGLMHLLYVPVIGILTLIAAFWGLGETCFLWDFRRGNRKTPPQVDLEESRPCSTPRLGVIFGTRWLAVAAALAALASALAPPTAGDALCYHLELPKAFLAQHSLAHLPYHDNSTFPLLTEMWYLWGLALDGPVCAQLVHWVMGVLLAMGAMLLAAPVVGQTWSGIVGAVVLLTPGINNQMTAPLNDLALAAMLTLALAAWWQAVVTEEDRRWYLVAGLAAGAALGIKHLALLAALALLPVWAWMIYRSPGRRTAMLQGAAALAIVALSIGGPWYARSAWYRGNPVYPFFCEVLGPAPTGGDPKQDSLPEAKAPLARRPGAMALSPWLVSLYPERFGGRGHQLGILFLAVLPGLVWARRLRGLGLLLAVAGTYWILWCLLRQNVRFLLPIVPILAIAVAWVCAEMGRLPLLPRVVGAWLVAIIVAATALVPLVRCRDQLAVAVGLEPRENYLHRREPTYAAAAAANQILLRDTRVLSQDHRTFYFNCPALRENVYRRATHYHEQLEGPDGFCRCLREQGFSHLLLAEKVEGPGIDYDPTLTRLAEAQMAADPKSLFTLADYRFRDNDGALVRYRLLMLR